MDQSPDDHPHHVWPPDLPPILLVGAGVVGCAIANAHAVRGIAFCLSDCSSDAIHVAAESFRASGYSVRDVELPLSKMSTIVVSEPHGTGNGNVVAAMVDRTAALRTVMVIESIVERVDVKRQLYADLQAVLGRDAILCSNTSTLRIDDIAGGDLIAPEKVCGMHFFMPVHVRPAVEIVAGRRSDQASVDLAAEHAARLGKRAIRCQDGPGFIVNRMLSPYLNQALLLICRGANEGQIARAALAYGMPMSPLELIDWIGAPTMYHAGKAYCSAFPHRIDPSPLVPALLKNKRLGRATGGGLYDYRFGQRSDQLAESAIQLIERYQVDDHVFSDGDVLMLLAIPMWIEAMKLIEEGVADSMDTVDLAMVGGLGFNSDQSWSGFFQELGSERIEQSIARWQRQFRSMSSSVAS